MYLSALEVCCVCDHDKALY